MPKPQIPLPETFAFHTDLPVRITDINYGGHLGNDALLSLLHEARIRFLKHHGCSEQDFGGAGMIMTDAELVFSSEAHAGEVLKVDVAMFREGRLRCELVYRVTEVSGGREVARARTGLVCFDYEKRKVLKIPDSIDFFQENPSMPGRP